MGVTTSAGRQWVVGLNKGALEGSWWFGSGWNHCTAPGAHLGVGRERFNLRKWLDGFSSAGWPRAEINQRGVGVRLPLWIPFLLIGLPTGWLWWRDRRRVPAGCCACGYDLTGNISGRCPECGALREVGTPEEVGRPKSEV
jgi:hypothetical protein